MSDHRESVLISSEKYQALMAAASALVGEHYFHEGHVSDCVCCSAIAALRAAGIDLEDKT